jgi:hypothetical protein
MAVTTDIPIMMTTITDILTVTILMATEGMSSASITNLENGMNLASIIMAKGLNTMVKEDLSSIAEGSATVKVLSTAAVMREAIGVNGRKLC